MKHLLDCKVVRRSVVPSFRRSVVPSFRRLRLSLLSFWLCLPLWLWSQVPADFAFAWNSKSEQAIFATAALKQVVDKPNYIFLAVSGNNKAFSVYTKSGNTALPTGLMAQWIAATIKPKNIVLLSSASGKLIQELTKDLATLDLKAGREVRTILSWTEDVLLYANGHIKGYGICNEYQYDVALKKVVVKAVAETAIPYGNVYAKDTDYMILNQSQNVWIDWLETWPNRKERPVMQIAVRDLKASIKDTPKAPLYDQLIQNKNCFTGWTYLWELDYKNSPYIPQLDFLCKAATICERYTRNPTLSVSERKEYEDAFRQFLKVGKKSAFSYLTEGENLTLTEFKAQVKKTIEAETLAVFFKKPKNVNITDVFQKKMAIIGESELNLATELGRKIWSPDFLLPEPLWNTLRTFVDNYPYPSTQEDDVLWEVLRGKFMETINLSIGTGAGLLDKDKDGNLKGLDFALLLKITNTKTGVITQSSSRGSVFEHWVRMKVPMKNEGKQTFYFEVTNKDTNEEVRTPIDNTAWNALKVKIKEVGTKVANATDAITKDKFAKELAALPEPKTRIIDCSYGNGGGALVSTPGKTCNLVCVEIKHTTGKLDGEPLKQFRDNVKLVRTDRMMRIEYIFSTKDAAIKNISMFIPIKFDKNEGFLATEKGTLFQVFFINDSGEKTEVTF